MRLTPRQREIVLALRLGGHICVENMSVATIFDSHAMFVADVHFSSLAGLLQRKLVALEPGEQHVKWATLTDAGREVKL